MCFSKISDQMADINALPKEILYSIFKMLNIKEKIGVERVCKLWQKLLTDLLSKQNSIKVNRGRVLSIVYGCSDHKHNQMTGEIDFIQISNSNIICCQKILNIEKLLPIMKRCINLMSISLEYCDIDFKSLFWMIEKSPKLECLSLIEINGFNSFEWEVIVKKLGKNLKHLLINYCDSITSQSLIPIVPQLQELYFIYQVLPLNDIFDYLGPDIRKIMIIHSMISNVNAIKSLVKGWGQSITHLSLANTSTNDEIESLSLICKYLKNLEYLSIGFEAHKLAISSIIELKKLTKLELKVNIFQWFAILRLPSNSLNGIQYLYLNVSFGSFVLMAITRVFINLKELKLFFKCKHKRTQFRKNGAVYYVCNLCDIKFLKMISDMKYLIRVQLNGKTYTKKIRN